MPRPARVVRPAIEGLETRALLAGRVMAPPAPSQVGFVGNPPDGSVDVSQQSSSATISLWRTNTQSTLQVQVTTVPSPAVGVNIGAVNQSVTFAPGQKEVSLSVPIIAGAPNANEVDAELALTPINPPANLQNLGPLDVKIMANDALIPPTIVGAQRTSKGIELTFSKPMNPASVTQVQNYLLHGTAVHTTNTNDVLAAVFLGQWGGLGNHTYSGRIRIRSASYDPGTQTVTLVPARPIDHSTALVVLPGIQTKTPKRPRKHTPQPQPLTDVQGNPINGDRGPNAFWVPVSPVS